MLAVQRRPLKVVCLLVVVLCTSELSAPSGLSLQFILFGLSFVIWPVFLSQRIIGIGGALGDRLMASVLGIIPLAVITLDHLLQISTSSQLHDARGVLASVLLAGASLVLGSVVRPTAIAVKD